MVLVGELAVHSLDGNNMIIVGFEANFIKEVDLNQRKARWLLLLNEPSMTTFNILHTGVVPNHLYTCIRCWNNFWFKVYVRMGWRQPKTRCSSKQLQNVKWGVLPHPPQSPDTFSSDYYLFQPFTDHYSFQICTTI